MVVMNIMADNLYAFNNFCMNMAYPKKIVGSSIPDEHLADRPNFRYKKVIVLMGANATGKTSLGKLLMDIFNFISKKESARLTGSIADYKKAASFSIDFVTNGTTLNRVSCLITPPETEQYKSKDISVKVEKAYIAKKDTYESCVLKLKEACSDAEKSYVEKLDEVEGMSWLFEFPNESVTSVSKFSPENAIQYAVILKDTLIDLDPRIKDVIPIEQSDNTYLIKYPHQMVILHQGQPIESDILSSGTYEGIGVANIIAALKSGGYGFVYCDEKFSHVNGYAEKVFLSLMIDCLKPNNQLFFTSHNSELLDMNLPKHSFVFMRRRFFGDDEECQIDTVSASEYLKRSTDSVRNAVENDLFSTIPTMDSVFNLMEG